MEGEQLSKKVNSKLIPHSMAGEQLSKKIKQQTDSPQYGSRTALWRSKQQLIFHSRAGEQPSTSKQQTDSPQHGRRTTL